MMCVCVVCALVKCGMLSNKSLFTNLSVHIFRCCCYIKYFVCQRYFPGQQSLDLVWLLVRIVRKIQLCARSLAWRDELRERARTAPAKRNIDFWSWRVLPQCGWLLRWVPLCWRRVALSSSATIATASECRHEQQQNEQQQKTIRSRRESETPIPMTAVRKWGTERARLGQPNKKKKPRARFSLSMPTSCIYCVLVVTSWWCYSTFEMIRTKTNRNAIAILPYILCVLLDFFM